MREINYYTILSLFIIGVFFQSCSSENGMEEITVSTSDINLTMDESPSNNQLITTIEGVTNAGEITFDLLSETPVGAFSVDQETGNLTVANSYFFDYENYQNLTATVTVNNGDVTKQSLINITLNDLLENDLLLLGSTSTVSLESASPFISDFSTELAYNGAYLGRWGSCIGDLNSDYYCDLLRLLEVIDEKVTVLRLLATSTNDVDFLNIFMTYDDTNRINSIRTYEPDTYYQIEYDNQNLTFIDQINNTNKTASLDNQNRVIDWSDGNDFFSVEYDGANLISKTYTINGVTHTTSYEYDNKRNPFKTISVLNLEKVLDYFRVIGFYSYSRRSNNISGNINNIIKINAPNGFFQNQIYEYEYNTDDYPSIKYVGDNEGEVVFTYQ